MLTPQQNKHNVLLCSVCPFLWYKYSYQERFQRANLTLDLKKAGPHEPVPTITGRKKKKSGSPTHLCPHTLPLTCFCPREPHCYETITQTRNSSFTWLQPHAQRMPSPLPSARTVQSLSGKKRFLCTAYFCFPVGCSLKHEGVSSIGLTTRPF